MSAQTEAETLALAQLVDIPLERRVRAGAIVLGIPASELTAALERARVVGILDAYARRRAGYSVSVHMSYTHKWWVVIMPPGGEPGVVGRNSWEGRTEDEARAKAAAAIEAGEV